MTNNKDSNPELTDVSGIGPARAKKLQKAGVKSPKQLARLKPSTVAEKADIATARAKKLVSAAKKVSSAAPKKSTKSTTTKKASAKKTTKKKAAPKKSAAKKSSSKKSTPKKKATKKQAAQAAAKAMQDIVARARDHFKQAPKEHVFVLHGGSTIKDLRELAEALEEMHEHVFKHHVNDDKHDFAAWVQHVLDEQALADQLREARAHPQSHGHVIYRHITRRVW